MSLYLENASETVGQDRDPSPYTLWYLSLSAGFFFLFQFPALPVVAVGAMRVIIVSAYIVVFVLDLRAFHAARPNAKEISAWWVLQPSVYLFKRCRRTSGRTAPFWVHLFLTIMVAVFDVSGAYNLRRQMAIDFAEGRTMRLPPTYPKIYVPVFPLDANAQKRWAPQYIKKFPFDPRLHYSLASVAYDADDYVEAERQLGEIADDSKATLYFPDVAVEAEALWSRIR